MKIYLASGTSFGVSTKLQTDNTYNKETIIKFDHVYYNEGGPYSPMTGIVTVHVSGVYVIMLNVQVYVDSSDTNRMAHVVRCVNGNTKAESPVTGLAPNLTGGNAVVLKVFNGDILLYVPRN